MRKGRVIHPGHSTEVIALPRTDKSPGPFAGRRSITETEMRDAESIHLVGPGEIEFREDGFGSMNFIVVSCDLDTELTTRDGQPAIAWSWYGDDDGHEASGRGWAVIHEDGCSRGGYTSIAGMRRTSRPFAPSPSQRPRARDSLGAQETLPSRKSREDEPLPENFSKLTSVELVQMALEKDTAVFKHVSPFLERHEPCPVAARVLVEAYRDGRAPAWLVAYLLGCVRSHVGYPVVREILLAGMGTLTESYAGAAMGKIGGSAAREELLDIVVNGETHRIREGAACGLRYIPDPSPAEAILGAFRAGHIGRFCAGRVVASLPGAVHTSLGWLASDDAQQETVGFDVASALLRKEGITDRALAEAIGCSLAARRVKVSPSERRWLEERIAPLLAPQKG